MPELINPYRKFVGSFAPNWLLRRKEIGSMGKLVYARLCQYAGDRGVAFPRIDVVASELGSSTKTVERAISELKGAGLLKVTRRGFMKSNLYSFLHHPWMDEGDDLVREEGDPEGDANPEYEPILDILMSDHDQTNLGDHDQTNSSTHDQTNLGGIRESEEENQLREKPERKTRKRKPPPTDHGLKAKQFIAWWCTEYRSTMGEDYQVSWGKEMSQIARLLESHSIETAQQTALTLLNSKDPWLSQRRQISILISQWNQLRQEFLRQEAHRLPTEEREEGFYGLSEVEKARERDRRSSKAGVGANRVS